jgi:hypothetical protein
MSGAVQSIDETRLLTFARGIEPAFELIVESASWPSPGLYFARSEVMGAHPAWRASNARRNLSVGSAR